MSKALTVKVPVTKVIEALENKVKEHDKTMAHNEKIEKEYPALLKKYSDALFKSLKDVIELHDVEYYAWRGMVRVEYKISKEVDVPEMPKKETIRSLNSHELEEIQNAIRILKMTEEEFVSASTMRAIANYL
jgi:hypothetical protein